MAKHSISIRKLTINNLTFRDLHVSGKSPKAVVKKLRKTVREDCVLQALQSSPGVVHILSLPEIFDVYTMSSAPKKDRKLARKLRNFAIRAIGRLDARAVTTEDAVRVTEMIHRLKAAELQNLPDSAPARLVKLRHRKLKSLPAARRATKVLSDVFELAVENGQLAVNPFR